MINIINKTETPAEPKDEGINALMSGGELMLKKARDMANLENADTAAAIKEICTAKETWQGGPFRILSAWYNNYSAEQLAEFPRPGVDTGNNPNAFQIKKTDASGKERMAKTTFYAQYALATKEGQVIAKAIGLTKIAIDPTSNKAGLPEEYANLASSDDGISTLKSRADQLRSRLNNMTLAFTKAAKLMWQISDISDMPLLSVDIRTTKDNPAALDGQTPFIVYTKPDEGKPVTEQKSFSIGSFLNLNPAKALEKGGTLKALQDTLQNTNGGAQTPANKERIKTVDTFVEVATDIHDFLDEVLSDSKQTLYGALLKELNKKGSDDLLVTVTELRNFFNDILNDVHNAGQRYTDIQKRSA